MLGGEYFQWGHAKQVIRIFTMFHDREPLFLENKYFMLQILDVVGNL